MVLVGLRHVGTRADGGARRPGAAARRALLRGAVAPATWAWAWLLASGRPSADLAGPRGVRRRMSAGALDEKSRPRSREGSCLRLTAEDAR
jgi:hypothetical protein